MAVRVIPPRGDKNCMFEFVAENKLQAMAYNRAIPEVMAGYNQARRENGLPSHIVFHQVGVTPFGDNEPGYHGWEIWGGEQDKLEELIPSITERAGELREESRQWYASDKDYWQDLTDTPEMDRHTAALAAEIEEDHQILCELHAEPTRDDDTLSR